MESFTVDEVFDGHIKLRQFNAIILDLMQSVWLFSFSFEIRKVQ